MGPKGSAILVKSVQKSLSRQKVFDAACSAFRPRTITQRIGLEEPYVQPSHGHSSIMNSRRNPSSLGLSNHYSIFVMLYPSIKNLIFDLGGVIIDLSIDDTLRSFAALAGVDQQFINKLYHSAPEFLSYETGHITDAEFRSFLNNHCSKPGSDAAIDQCWNGMLRALPKNKLDLILRLRDKYNVFLLSNTNAIHVKYINEVMLPAIPGALPSLDSYFDRAYYSHLMKKRKPHAEIFEQVLNESNLVASESLFLDDNHDNILGASKVGINTAFVNSPDFILTYFNEG